MRTSVWNTLFLVSQRTARGQIVGYGKCQGSCHQGQQIRLYLLRMKKGEREGLLPLVPSRQPLRQDWCWIDSCGPPDLLNCPVTLQAHLQSHVTWGKPARFCWCACFGQFTSARLWSKIVYPPHFIFIYSPLRSKHTCFYYFCEDRMRSWCLDVRPFCWRCKKQNIL